MLRPCLPSHSRNPMRNATASLAPLTATSITPFFFFPSPSATRSQLSTLSCASLTTFPTKATSSSPNSAVSPNGVPLSTKPSPATSSSSTATPPSLLPSRLSEAPPKSFLPSSTQCSATRCPRAIFTTSLVALKWISPSSPIPPSTASANIVTASLEPSASPAHT